MIFIYRKPTATECISTVRWRSSSSISSATSYGLHYTNHNFFNLEKSQNADVEETDPSRVHKPVSAFLFTYTSLVDLSSLLYPCRSLLYRSVVVFISHWPLWGEFKRPALIPLLPAQGPFHNWNPLEHTNVICILHACSLHSLEKIHRWMSNQTDSACLEVMDGSSSCYGNDR